MAEFRGFVCDGCQNVWAAEMKTREKRTFSGYKAIGDFYRELCPDCVVEPVGLATVRRRKRRGQAASQDEVRGGLGA